MLGQGVLYYETEKNSKKTK